MWKPPYDKRLGHARINTYMAQLHPTHCKKLFCQSDLGDGPLPKSRNSHCLEGLEHGDNSPSSTFLQRSVFFGRKSDWERETGRLSHVWKAFQVAFVQFRIFLRARKPSISRYHIRSCHMLPKSKIVFKKCCWNRPIPGKTHGNYHCKTKYSRYFVRNVSTFLSLRASLATGTTGLSISKTVQSNVHIPFHLRSKLRSKGFRKPCKLLLTWNALVHKSFVQNADSASPFSRSSPHWIESGTLCWRTFQSGTLCVFKDAGATRSRIASWLEPAMQQRAGLAVFFSVEKLMLRKSRSCQRFRYETGGSYRQLFNIFWWKTPGLARGNFWCLWNGRFL